MRRRSLCSLSAFCITILLGCASTPVSLDRVRGVYTTHFDGIPDQSRVCAVLTNQGKAPIRWVRLKLRTWDAYRERRRGRTSYWVYREPISPGASVAVELENPPIVSEIRLSVHQSGRGAGGPAGRPARRSQQCSQAELIASARADSASRTAAGIEIRAVAQHGRGDADVLVASD